MNTFDSQSSANVLSLGGDEVEMVTTMEKRQKKNAQESGFHATL